MSGRIILAVVAVCVAGLLCVFELSGRPAAGMPGVAANGTVGGPQAPGRCEADRNASQPAFTSAGTAAPKAARESVRTSFSRLPLYFVENRGVYADEVAFTIQGADKTLFFTPDGITMRLRGKDRGWVVKLEFVDAEPVTPRGEEPQEAVFSYFKGPKEDWKTGLRSYSRVVYENLWPGIDLVYRGTVNRLKYEFLVKPGADPGSIRLRYRGVESLERTATGALSVKTPAGGFEDAPPEAWQEIDGRRVPVAMAYRLDAGEAGGVANCTPDVESTCSVVSTRSAASAAGTDGRSFGFHVGDYDATKPLVLDPVILVYCGYIGGSGDDYGYGIAVDGAGHVYVTGHTSSAEQSFPVSAGPDLTYNGNNDVFVVKVNATGKALVYCGYIGGSAHDSGESIAVDGIGNAYITGCTLSNEQTFPVLVGPDLTHNGSNSDAFVVKVNASGTGLVYCGYIGGSSEERGAGIAVDRAGNAYVTGETLSNEQSFPVFVGPDLTYNGGLTLSDGDAFVTKVNASGTGLVYCGYIGGSSLDVGEAIAVDGNGNAYVAGWTASTEQSFPVTVGPDIVFGGGNNGSGGDAFVAKLTTAGTGFVYCGYIGGSGPDFGYDIAVDGSGHAYVTGRTNSSPQTFPVTVGPDLSLNGGCDAFVAKVMPTGTGLVYCGYIGGAHVDCGYGIAVDRLGNAYVAGRTYSTEQTFPVLVGPDMTCNGGYDGFVAKVDKSGKRFVHCGYIGGSGDDRCSSIAVDGVGNALVTGWTQSSEQTFPVLVGPDSAYNGGKYDAFVVKVSGTVLAGSGSPVPGKQVKLFLLAPHDAGLAYQLGSSLGNGPIMIDTRPLELSPDPMLALSTSGVAPWTFQSYAGLLDANGQATAAIQIPNSPALKGTRIYTAFVTLNASAPSGISSVSNTFLFTIQ